MTTIAKKPIGRPRKVVPPNPTLEEQILREEQTPTERRGSRASFGKLNRQTIDIRTFYLQKNLYFNIPKRQRGRVWPYWQKQLFIDTLLRGREFMDIDELALNAVWRSLDDGRSEMIYEIEGGLQRLTTIYDFLEGRLHTFDLAGYYRHVLINDYLPPLPFHKTYKQLPNEMQERFINYALPVKVAEDVAPAIAGERYRRRNLGKPHTTGEDFRSFYPTAALLLADTLAEHPLWQSMFANKKRADRSSRSYRSEMCLYLIYMYLHGAFVQLPKLALMPVAAGCEDAQLTPAVTDALLHRLDDILHLCKGVTITAKTDAIPLWQMLLYLEQATCDIQASQEGCLAPWFSQAKENPVEGIKRGNLTVFAGMTSLENQRLFWAKHTRLLLSQPGLVFRNTSTWKTVRDGQEQAPALQRARIDPESSLVLTEHDRSATAPLPTTGV